jgi:hypothetical protein
MGMGVGDNPSYFAGRGEYVAHERGILQAFADEYFTFQPKVKSIEESIEFLISECGIDKNIAECQCKYNNILITERIIGVPFATQTGHFLNYDPDIAVFDSEVLLQAEHALNALQKELAYANRKGLLHNDPMPSNIVFEQDEEGNIVARLVDFELAQTLNGYTPAYVSNHIPELYVERQVPNNSKTGKYLKNLDQHLLEQAIQALKQIRNTIKEMEDSSTHFKGIWFTVPFLSWSMNIGEAMDYWNNRTLRHGLR